MTTACTCGILEAEGHFTGCPANRPQRGLFVERFWMTPTVEVAYRPLRLVLDALDEYVARYGRVTPGGVEAEAAYLRQCLPEGAW